MISLRSIGNTILGEILAKGFGFLTFLIIIRFSETHEFAEYTILFASGSIIYAFLGPPVNRVFIIEGERLGLGHNSDFLAVVVMPVAILITTGALMSAAVRMEILLVVFYAGARLLGDFGRNSSQRDRQFGRAAFLGSARAGLWLVLVGVLAFSLPRAMTAVNLLLTNIAADISIFAWFVLCDRLRFTIPRKPHLKALYRICTPPLVYVFAYNGLLGIFGQIELYLLESHSDDHDLASYGSAFRFYGLLLLIVSSTNAVYLPSIASAKTKDQFKALLKSHRRISLLFSGVVAAAACTAGIWMPLADGNRYPEAVRCFQLLAVSGIASFWFSLHGGILMRHGRYSALLKVLVMSAVLTFPVRYWLAESYGSIGAAGGYLFAFVIFNGTLSAICSRTSINAGDGTQFVKTPA